MRVILPEARAIFAEAGASVDPDTMVVRLDPAQVSDAISQAPREFELMRRLAGAGGPYRRPQCCRVDGGRPAQRL